MQCEIVLWRVDCGALIRECTSLWVYACVCVCLSVSSCVCRTLGCMRFLSYTLRATVCPDGATHLYTVDTLQRAEQGSRQIKPINNEPTSSAVSGIQCGDEASRRLERRQAVRGQAGRVLRCAQELIESVWAAGPQGAAPALVKLHLVGVGGGASQRASGPACSGVFALRARKWDSGSSEASRWEEP